MTTVYVDPQTIHNPAAGGKPPATWGDTVRDDIATLAKPPMVKVKRTTDLSVPHVTGTAIPFDSEEWDTDAFHSTSSNTSRITIPSGFGGRYLVIGSVGWGAETTGYRQAYLLLNGATWIADSVQSAAMGYLRQHLMCEVAVTAGDYVELVLIQNTGGTISATASGMITLSARLVSWA